MNYFAHGCRFVDAPLVLIGTAVPDWLSVVDRRVRIRQRQAEKFVDDADPRIACIARGIAAHHRDDAWFHTTEAFVELSLRFTVDCRRELAGDDSFRPSFLGHVLVELLLDAELAAADGELLHRYYQAIESIDPVLLESMISRIAGRPVEGLAWFISRFCRERFLWDYSDDARLMLRLNQVFRRVGLVALPPKLICVFGPARQMVAGRLAELSVQSARASLGASSSITEPLRCNSA